MNNYTESLSLPSNLLDLSLQVAEKGKNIFDDTVKCMNQLRLDSSRLAIPLQKHTNHVLWTTKPGKFRNCDGILTNLTYNVILSLSAADCVPVCIFDEVTGNFGLIHSGWRGTSTKISRNAVYLLIENGSDIKDLKIYMGPSISQKNYEVDIDVACLFLESNYIKKREKYLLDIKSQIKNDLIQIGLSSNQISQSSRCTYNDNSLPSYRRDGLNSGRLIFLMRKK